ncbi:MAG: hypothetical protein EBQ94_09115, partial [Flavobacteriales bacterium]|nr:hypothetical protein [Flavobacteriales bacterium]
MTVTDAGSCTSVAVTYTINLVPVIPSSPIVGTITQPTCTTPTGSVELSGLPSGNWTINSVNVAGNTATTTITGLVPNTYSFTVTDANGCISIATANVIIDAVPSVTPIFQTPIVCANSPVPTLHTSSDNGITGTWSPSVIDLTQSTVYVFTPNAGQCATTQTLNLSYSFSSSSNTRDTVCASYSFPYIWNGLSFYTNGSSQNFVTTNAAGCDSVAAFTLVVLPSLTSTTNITVCQDALDAGILWNGLTITAAGSHQGPTLPALGIAGCDSIPTLVVTVSPVITSNTNITICQNQLATFNWNSIPITGSGTYTYQTQSVFGSCDSIATLNLTIVPQATSTTNLAICHDQLPYSWNGLIFNAAGTQTATLPTSSPFNCDSLATLVLTIKPVLTSTLDTTICANQLATFTWGGLPPSTFINVPFQTISTSLTSLVTLCDSIASINLTIIPAVTGTDVISSCTAITWIDGNV